MDLFVINRYKEHNEEGDLITQETEHLQRLKQKIEERKKAHTVHKDNEVITLRQEQILQTSINEIAESEIYDEEAAKSKENLNVTEDAQKKSNKNLVKDKSSYKILGARDFEKKNKVQRVLPHWLSLPKQVSRNLKDLNCSVEDQHWLHSTLKSTLLNDGVTHLFPVQEKVIPFILKQYKLPSLFWPHDVCVSAPTGSGKTLSFVLPIVQILMNETGRHVRALIVLPVQELAIQVSKVFKKYCAKTSLKVALLSGSTPLQQEQQLIVSQTESKGWISEVDIIVCTAGRLVEHLQNTEGFSLKHLKFLVIDEADRIMDHIQNDWLYHMDRHIKTENELMTGKVPSLCWNSLSDQKPPPHKLLFSATLSQDPEKLEQWGLFQPKLFSAASVNEHADEDNIRTYTTPDELEEQFVTCNPEEKPLVLYHFLFEKKWDKIICFTNSAQSAHRLTVLLKVWGKGELKVAELSASLDRTDRESVLKKFTQSEINVLIGTDALARGIDIPDCNYVISYDPPRNIKTYIHRVGRTGRAGRIGHAITILLQNQLNVFKELLQSGRKSEIPEIRLDIGLVDRLSESYGYAMQETKNRIHSEINSKVKKAIGLKRGSKAKPQKRKFSQISNNNN